MRICIDDASTLDFFSYVVLAAPNLLKDDGWTLEEAIADFREGIATSLTNHGISHVDKRLAALLTTLDRIYSLYRINDRKSACRDLQTMRREFEELCRLARANRQE